MFFVFLYFILCTVEIADGLSCRICEKDKCIQPSCKGRTVIDPCHCCQECAKYEGELCGGPFRIFGQCDHGLSCQMKKPYGEIPLQGKGICAKPGLKCVSGKDDNFIMKECNSTENTCYNATVTYGSYNTTDIRGCSSVAKYCDVCNTEHILCGTNCSVNCCRNNMCNSLNTTIHITTTKIITTTTKIITTTTKLSTTTKNQGMVISSSFITMFSYTLIVMLL